MQSTDSQNHGLPWSSSRGRPVKRKCHHLSPIFTFGVEVHSHGQVDESRKNVRKGLVPRAGVEPARPFGQRILSPVIGPLPTLTKRYKPVFTRLVVVNVSLRLAWYQHVPPPS